LYLLKPLFLYLYPVNSVVDYDPQFHFCQPPGAPVKQSESLGSIIFGDRIFSSPLELKMLQNSSCNVLCHSQIPAAVDDVSDGRFINERIVDSYSMNWLIDGLPAARIRIDPQSGERFYSVGFELGQVDNAGTPMLNTHYDIVVEYHVHLEEKLLTSLDGVEGRISSCGVYCATFESGYSTRS
jgi:transmembrane 9 superfamily protein 2/4